MKKVSSSVTFPAFLTLAILVLGGCAADAQSESTTEEVESSEAAVEGDPCAGQPDARATNRHGILGYACEVGPDGYDQILLYCRGGETQTLDCSAYYMYCMDYTVQYPGSAANCEDGGW